MRNIFLAAVIAAGTALAQTAPEMKQILAGKKFTPPIKGEALIDFMAPVTKRDGANVVTKITVRNASLAPVPRLTIAETWYDKGGSIVVGSKGTVPGLMQPGEIQTVTITTPWSAKTVSITIEPPSMNPSCTAAIDTTGIAALRAACFSTIDVRDSPLARAVRM